MIDGGCSIFIYSVGMMIMCTHLQIVAAVVPAVENFLSECARSVATTDVSLRDYFCLRLDSIIMNLEELMQCVGTNCQLQHCHPILILVMMNLMSYIVKSIQRDFPNAGLVMVQGYLQSRGVQVQRYKVRQSVARNDPIRRKVRWHQPLNRRTYSVPGPNAYRWTP